MTQKPSSTGMKLIIFTVLRWDMTMITVMMKVTMHSQIGQLSTIYKY